MPHLESCKIDYKTPPYLIRITPNELKNNPGLIPKI